MSQNRTEPTLIYIAERHASIRAYRETINLGKRLRPVVTAGQSRLPAGGVTNTRTDFGLS
jgi:hypothetical protein